MKFNEHFKHPRLFISQTLQADTPISLDKDQAHYLKNVMRKKSGDTVRLFNDRDGEWLASLDFQGKKDTYTTPFELFKPQPENQNATTLIFAPIKKKNLDFLIEKAIELGATKLIPVLTARTENRHLKLERLEKHIIEATEQCERLDLASISLPQPLKTVITNITTPIHWAAERSENTLPLSKSQNAETFLIGPEGGFDDDEIAFLETQDHVKAINLGEQILRAETASILCLALAKLNRE